MKKLNCKFIDASHCKGTPYAQLTNGENFLYEVCNIYARKAYLNGRAYVAEEDLLTYRHINPSPSLLNRYLVEICLDYDEGSEEYYLFQINDFDIKQVCEGDCEKKKFKYFKEMENELKTRLSKRFGTKYENAYREYHKKMQEIETFELEY